MPLTKIRGNEQIMAESINDSQISSAANISLGKLADVVVKADGTQNLTNAWNVGNSAITGLPAPEAEADAANKGYVDQVAQGLDPKESVRISTKSDIGGNYNSTGGISNTGSFGDVDLTNLNIFDVSGISLANGDRLLIKDQVDLTQNGIYKVTASGASGSIIRAEDHDGEPGAEVSGGNFVFIEQGVEYKTTGWVLKGDGTLILNTDDIDWTQFSGAGTYSAGDGLDLSGTQFSVDVTDFIDNTAGIEENSNNIQVKVDSTKAIVIDSESGLQANVDDVTVGINGNALNVKDGGIDSNKIATDSVNKTHINVDVAGSGLTQAADGALQVNPDNTGIELNSDTLRIKDDGIITAKILDSNVTTAKIANNAIISQKIDSGAVIETKIANGAITTNKVSDSNITSAKLANDSITAKKIGTDVAGLGLTQATDGSLEVNPDDTGIELNGDTLQLKDNGVTNAKINTNAVSTAKITDSNVTTAKVANDAIINQKIADNAISSNKIADDSVSAAKINADVAGSGLTQNGVDGSLEVNNGDGLEIIDDSLKVKVNTGIAADGNGVKVNYVKEVPSITDGSASILLSNSPALGTEMVFLNGIIQDEGGSDDYTITESVLTFSDSLQTGDKVIAWYLL